MRLSQSISAILLLAPCAVLLSQTADRSASPPSSATSAPPAQRGTYTIQNGDLIVAPGLRIPNGNVPWALDIVGGKQVLVPIHHSSVELPGKVAGPASHTPLHTDTPLFFVHTSDRTENTGDAGRGTPTGWALVSAKADGTSRTVDEAKFSQVSNATVCAAPLLCMAAESLPDGWLRFTPKEPMQPGEYVLLPVPRSGAAVSVVYDFTIDQASPAAKDTVSPGQNLDSPKGKKKH